MKLDFKMNDLGKIDYFLGMKLLYNSMGLIMHQENQAKYANKILKK